MNETWVTRATWAGAARSGGVSVTVSGVAYFGLGLATGGVYKKDWWLYSSSTDAFTQLTDFPGNARTLACIFAVGSNIYVGCGKDGAASYKDWYRYDTGGGAWYSMDAIPEVAATYYGQACFSVETKGYVVGGFDGSNPMDHVYEYDTETSAWRQLADYGGTPVYYGSGFSLGSLGFVCGGYDGATNIKETWEYNPEAETWTQKGDMPETLSYAPVTVIGNRAYYCTGWDGAAVSGGFAFYSPDTATWTDKTAFADPRRGAFVFKVRSSVYVLCGDDGAGGYSDLVLNQWIARLETPTNFAGTLVANGDTLAVSLTWDDNSIEETVYIVERVRSDEVSFSRIALLPANSTSYVDDGVDLNTYEYRWRVRCARTS